MEENHRVTIGLRIKPPASAECTATAFDKVFSYHANQEIYRALVCPMVEGMSSSTIFTYGRTGSGKTYTMFGDAETPGISEFLMNDLITTHRFIYVRCIEIYNEVVTDVLSGEEVRLVQESDRVRIVCREETRVSSRSEAAALLARVKEQKRTSATEHNGTSSRSHTVIEVTAPGLCVNLVDLAGNEKIGENLERRKEGLLINKSLLTLGKVIDQLHRDTPHVSYRESKLTRILQRTLAEGSILCICTVLDLEDTQTIKFAERLKRIKHTERVREKTKDEIIEDLQMQVRYLTAQLSAVSFSSSPENRSPAIMEEGTPSAAEDSEASAGSVPSTPEIVETPSSSNIVEAIHVDAHTPQSQINLYEMIYCYFRNEVTPELSNTLTSDDIDKVRVTVTTKKRDPAVKHRLKTVRKETRTEIRPYEEPDA